MKLSSLIGAGVLLPGLSEALVGVDWSFDHIPKNGLKDVTFPFKLGRTPHVRGYYYAQQFSFKNLRTKYTIGYCGLQPRADDNDGTLMNSVFSSFIAGTRSNDPNCDDGADGGAGVSCSNEVNLPYDDNYEIEVKNVGGKTWTGTLYGRKYGSVTHIGTYTLPKAARGIDDYQGGFMEYYPWNDGEDHPCRTLPYGEVTFGDPTTTFEGAVGSVSEPYEYGDCEGKVKFKTNPSKLGGYFAKVGFKRNN